MMCSNRQLTSAHEFLSLFIFFCHCHHMGCFFLSDLRIFSLSLHLCEWLAITLFHLYFIYSSAGFCSCPVLVSSDKIPQVVTRFLYITTFSTNIWGRAYKVWGLSPYVRLGHQLGSALMAQLCSKLPYWRFCSRWHYHHLEWWGAQIVSWLVHIFS